MKEKELTPQESLELIQQTILRSRRQFTDNSFYFLLWGTIVGLASLVHYYLEVYTDYEQPYIAWTLTFLGAIVSVIKGISDGKKSQAKRTMDIPYAWLWMSLGIGMFIIAFNQEMINHQVVPVILVMAGVGTATSGAMMRFLPLQIGAGLFWVMSIIAFSQEMGNQMLIMAIAVALGYLVPGFMIRANARKNAI